MISNTWDVKLMQVLVEQYGQEYYSALDAWYTALREDIVLIQWCADWRNDLVFWMDEHGPLRAFIYPGKSGGRIPTYTLIGSGRTIKFTKYFGEQMDQLSMLSNEDLVSLIQHSWRAALKGVSIENTHTGIEYDGAYETPEFVRKRSIWLSKIQSEYDNHSAYWITNNKDCQYDMMQPPVMAIAPHNLNTNIYCISPTFSLVTSSALSLICPFTTSAKPSKGSNKNKGSGKKYKSKGNGASRRTARRAAA